MPEHDTTQGYAEVKEVGHHKPHPHAKKRVILGVGACLAVCLGVLVWYLWGDTIKDACTGKDACTIELPPEGAGDSAAS